MPKRAKRLSPPPKVKTVTNPVVTSNNQSDGTRPIWVNQDTTVRLLKALEGEACFGGIARQLKHVLAEFKDDALRLKELTARARSNSHWTEQVTGRIEMADKPSLRKAKRLTKKRLASTPTGSLFD